MQRGETVKKFWICMGLTAWVLSPAAMAMDETIAGNTCHLSLSAEGIGEVLDLKVTYLSRPVLEAMFESEEIRDEVAAATGGQPAFVVTATARRPTQFYGTSLVFEQDGERMEPGRSDLLPLEGAFGGRLGTGASTSGLVLLPSTFDPTRSVTIEYASIRQVFLFPSTTPLVAARRSAPVRSDPIREIQGRLQDVEERLEALEKMFIEP